MSEVTPEVTPGINPAAAPSGMGCKECLALPDGWWVHLRRCAECGHIGCCDSSPHQHARRHYEETGHAIITSFEPGETWFYNFETGETFEGPALAPPANYPPEQGAPAPAGRVPTNWKRLINR